MKRIDDLWYDFLQVLWYLSWIAIIIFSLRGCYRSHIERVKENEARKLQEIRDKFAADSIAHVKDSIAHVMDSLRHDPHYQDSIKKAKEDRENRIMERTLVITCDTDSIYHSSTVCTNMFANATIGKYRLATAKEIESLGYTRCTSCSIIEGFVTGDSEFEDMDIENYVFLKDRQH